MNVRIFEHLIATFQIPHFDDRTLRSCNHVIKAGVVATARDPFLVSGCHLHCQRSESQNQKRMRYSCVSKYFYRLYIQMFSIWN